jgi:diphosphomevalonate decarboxylase
VQISSAYANANIALVKYWGKSDDDYNIPATPSLSMTLDRLGTRVSVHSSLHKHILVRENKIIDDEALGRLNNFLEQVRADYPYEDYLHISTYSNIPYGAGLASSSAFFAGLAYALNDFLKLKLSTYELSLLARRGSASAARSICGGFVGLYGGFITHHESYAFSVKIKTSFKLALIIAVINDRPKAVSSREAMIHTKKTSPYFESWVKTAPSDFLTAQRALLDGSLEPLGLVMEHSTLKMHAAMWAAQPSINYLCPQSMQLINFIYDLRKTLGPIAFFTMDAGPNIKILCEAHNVASIMSLLKNSQLCSDLRLSYAGDGASLCDGLLA